MEKLTEKKFWEALEKLQKHTEYIVVFYQKEIEIGAIYGSGFLDEGNYSIEDLGNSVFRIDCDDVSLFADSYKIYEP